MKAAQVEGKGIIRCIEAPIPEPGGGLVQVRTKYASLCGSDLHHLYMPLGPGHGPARPGAPGHEAIGMVVESDSDAFRPGQLVLTAPDIGDAACFADVQALSPAFMLPLPEGVPPERLMLAQPLGTVIYGLKFLMPASLPETAVVLGQGSIGLFFTWLLKRAGIRQLVTSDLEAPRRALSLRFGANVSVDGNETAASEAVHALTRGRGAPLVVEAAGADRSRALALRLAAMGGTVGFFGLPTSHNMDGFPIEQLFRKKLTLRSVYGTQTEPGLASFREALDLIAGGAIDVGPLLTHRFPIDRIDEAFAAAHERDGGILKACITFD